MFISDIIRLLESVAHPSYQESYDNAGLLTGSPAWICRGVLVCLDATEEVIREAAARDCNLVVAHHPIVFSGLKRLNGANYIERAVISAIKQDVAIYAIHTNLDNVIDGVNGRMADRLGLTDRQVLLPRQQALMKLHTYVPPVNADTVRNALFAAGAGHISRYSECSFNTPGEGTFKAGEGADPYLGKVGLRETTPEIKIEVILPAHASRSVTAALLAAHPYEEVAYDLVPLANTHAGTGSGLTGLLPQPMDATGFLALLTGRFGLKMIRHTPLLPRKIEKVALCGGAGSFLIHKAIAAGADVFVSADIKYHEFFDANGQLVIADIGHYESEQFTIDLLYGILQEKFPTFAVLKTGVETNPVRYFL